MAKTNWSELLAAIITNVVVPEVINLINAHNAANTPVTAEELKVVLLEKTSASIAVGEAFLKAHGVEP